MRLFPKIVWFFVFACMSLNLSVLCDTHSEFKPKTSACSEPVPTMSKFGCEFLNVSIDKHNFYNPNI